MSSIRTNEKPSYAEITELPEREKLQKEIQKIKPRVEISIEGLSEVAKGRIVDWNPQRKLFTVKWEKKSEKFDEMTDKQTGLRVFCKSQLFSTQVIFKTTTVRHLEDGTYHYRIPIQWFKQQRRGALRVPIHNGNAVLASQEGRFKILDLSVSGARLRCPKGFKASKLMGCELNLDGYRLKTADFSAGVTYTSESEIGVRFVGLSENIKTEMKHFLLDALKIHYEKEW
jgi:hypothetical protein